MRNDRIKLVETLKAGIADRRGATAVVFAVAFAVTAPLALGVFDIYTSSQQRAKLQDALDAATLYAAKSSAMTHDELNVQGKKMLDANLKLIDNARLVAYDFNMDGTKVVASASVDLPAFAPALFDHSPVSVGSQVERAMDNLEVALVLDNTGSMAGTKIATLITESKKLVAKLELAAARSSNKGEAVRIALVPFSASVRLDTTTLPNYSGNGAGTPDWIDRSGKAHRLVDAAKYDIFKDQTDRLKIMRDVSQPWAGCIEARTQPYDVTDEVPSTSLPATNYVPYFWPDEPDSTHKDKNGKIVADYANDYIKDQSPYVSAQGVVDTAKWRENEQDQSKYSQGFKSGRTGTFGAVGGSYKYGPNAGCTLQPVIPLTNNIQKITDAITAMKAIGTTNIPQGLAWGWHVLSPNNLLKAPTAPRTYDVPHTRKIIILMTDGQNTFDAPNPGKNEPVTNLNKSDYTGLGYVWQRMLGTAQKPIDDSTSNANRTAAMNDRLKTLCENIKKVKDAQGNSKYEIYTILVEDSSTVSTLLQACASSPDKFYNVTNVSTLGVAFDAIAGSITNLRLSH